MKISVNDKELYSLNETQKKVICDYIPKEILEKELNRRLEWVLMHLYSECFKSLKKKWESKLEKVGVESVPTNKDKFAQVVFAQKDYKDRSARNKDSKI